MIRVLIFGLLLGCPGVGQLGQSSTGELTAKLQQNVGEYTLEADNFLQALAKVAARFQLPMGIEWVRSPVTSRRVYHSWRYTTPMEILRSVVGEQPDYSLQIKDGIVHVFPKGSLESRADFLNLRVDRFAVQNETVTFASYRLWARFHSVVAPPPKSQGGGPGGGVAGSIASGLGDRDVSFVVENGTVRDVLDQLALAAGFKVWVVSYPEHGGVTRAGFRRATSIFGLNEHYPDEAQPVWDLLLWGFDPVTKTPQPGWGSTPRQ